MRNLILYISLTLDGYIAKPQDDLSFLSIVQKEGEDYGYSDFIKTIDTVIVGRRTYDWVVKQGYDFPHADKESYIITRTKKYKSGNVTFYNGNLQELVLDLKKKNGKSIFCDGGAEIANILWDYNLIDELIISVIPIIIGKGTRLFKEGCTERNLKLQSSRSYDTGLVQLHYKCNTESIKNYLI